MIADEGARVEVRTPERRTDRPRVHVIVYRKETSDHLEERRRAKRDADARRKMRRGVTRMRVVKSTHGGSNEALAPALERSVGLRDLIGA